MSSAVAADSSGAERPPTLPELVRQLLPLSFSDAAMALADPLLAVVLTRMPNPTVHLAALGVVKSLAVFVESPIIMVLHASTALGGSPASRRALNRFVWILGGLLTLIMLALVVPLAYRWLAYTLYELPADVGAAAYWPLLLMFAWPGLIAFRRIHQGRLILQGRGKEMGAASLFRVGLFSLVLFGLSASGLGGATVGAAALMAGLALEAWLAYRWARRQPTPEEPGVDLPESVPAVARYYTPLALTMMVMWGGRAALVAILARSVDSQLALAAWAASWGFVILLGNLTRMVQQLVIKYARKVPVGRLFALGGVAGLTCTAGLALLAFSSPGLGLLGILLGGQPELLKAAQSVVAWSVPLPLLVAYQNVFQGYCISVGKSLWINIAGLVGVVLTVAVAWVGVSRGLPGATVAAVAVVLGLALEVAILGLLRPWSRLDLRV